MRRHLIASTGRLYGSIYDIMGYQKENERTKEDGIRRERNEENGHKQTTDSRWSVLPASKHAKVSK